MWTPLPPGREKFILYVTSVRGTNPLTIALDSGEFLEVEGIQSANQQSAFSNALYMVRLDEGWRPVREMRGAHNYWRDNSVSVTER